MIPEVRFSVEQKREIVIRAYYTPFRLDSVSRWAAFHEVGPTPFGARAAAHAHFGPVSPARYRSAVHPASRFPSRRPHTPNQSVVVLRSPALHPAPSMWHHVVPATALHAR